MDDIVKKINKLKSDFHSDNSKSSKMTFSGYHFIIDIISGLSIGFLAGYYIDEYLDTKPIFIFCCAVLGITAGLYNAYKQLNIGYLYESKSCKESDFSTKDQSK